MRGFLSLIFKLLCVCGCGGEDATLVANALKKIVRIKLQMNTEVWLLQRPSCVCRAICHGVLMHMVLFL